MFDLSLTKLLVLAVIALLVFGPNELPKIAAQAGRALRDLRRIAEGAKADLKEGLGPEFQDFDFEDLNPRRFVQKHLFDEPGPESDKPTVVGAVPDVRDPAATAPQAVAAQDATVTTASSVQADDRPPFDLEAT